MQSPRENVCVSERRLEGFTCDILSRIGFPSPAADVVARQLVESDLSGCYSHGVALLPWYHELVINDEMNPDAVVELAWDRGAMVGLDGRFGVGQLCGAMAADVGVERARRYGISCVVGRNAGHLGRLGHYTEAIARAGCASILSINYEGGGQTVAPYGGTEARLSNNPVSIGAPAPTTPVVTDMALSAAAGVKVLTARERRQAVPPGWLMEADGTASTDPLALERGGTLQPLGSQTAGHKGYGLIVLLDILSGILSGGGACHAGAPRQFLNAFCLITIDVERARIRGEYDAEVEALRRYVKSSALRPEHDEIFFPGEREAVSTERQRATGIGVDANTWKQLGTLANRVGAVLPPMSTTADPPHGPRRTGQA
jgi:uncharacterized oxidoreductase